MYNWLIYPPQCEDDSSAFIIRMYEAYGSRGSANITINNLPSDILSAQA